MNENGPTTDRIWNFNPEVAGSELELTGYRLVTTDGDLGRVIDQRTGEGENRYLVVDTGDQRDGHHAIPVGVIGEVDESNSCLHVAMSAQDVRSAPPWTSAADVTNEYLTNLYQHFSSYSW